MCFYVYAPSHSVNVKYVSEKIWPTENRFFQHHSPFNQWNGTSRICIDIVITNKGCRNQNNSLGIPIEKFFIIYPNLLFNYDDRNGTPAIKPKIVFRDVTLELMNSLWVARTETGKFKQVLEKEFFIPVDQAIIDHEEIHPEGYNLTLKMPDPNSLAPEPSYRYCVKGRVDVKPVQEGSIPNVSLDALYEIMEYSGITILECQFTTPLDIGEDRWIRFDIFPKSTSSTETKFFASRLVDVYFNRNSYRYEIKGPYNVLYEMFSRMESLKVSIKETVRQRDPGATDPYEATVKDIPYEDRIAILNKRLSELFQGIEELERQVDHRKHPTNFEDWRLLVFENNGAMTGIREYGIFRISGSFSQVVPRHVRPRLTKLGHLLDKLVHYWDELVDKRGWVFTRHDRVYTWKTGRKNVCPRTDGFKSFYRSKKEDKINTLPEIEGETISQCPAGLGDSCGQDRCIPYVGNFRIAYTWTKGHKVVKFIILSVFAVGVIKIVYFIRDLFLQ